MAFVDFIGRQVVVGNDVIQMPEIAIPATDEEVILFEETIAAINRAASHSVEIVQLAKELSKGIRVAIEQCFKLREAEDSGREPRSMFDPKESPGKAPKGAKTN